jgi:hypothetical protein
MSSNETLVVSVMASLKGAAEEYALTPDAQGKVSATRPGARVMIPFNEKDRITAVRKSVEKKQQDWTWRGEVEGTGEPVMLMWWKGGKFTGIFTIAPTVPLRARVREWNQMARYHELPPELQWLPKNPLLVESNDQDQGRKKVARSMPTTQELFLDRRNAYRGSDKVMTNGAIRDGGAVASN